MNSEKFKAEMGFLKPRKSVDGIAAFDCRREDLLKAAKLLRDDFEFQALSDIASIDMGVEAGESRFGAVYHFYSHTKKYYIRLVCMCESSLEPELPSLCSVYKGADWLEREAYDLMGISFEGHPRLKRILMWDSYPWHPLRKDFPLAGREAPLPPSFEEGYKGVEIKPAPEEGGPFHSPSCGHKFSPEREPRSVDGACERVDNI